MAKKVILWGGIVLILLLVLPFLGSTKIGFSALWTKGNTQFIFWQLRVPRVLLGFLAGSIFALLGLLSQNLFKNNLATPDILGVCSGTAAGSALAIKLGFVHSFLGLSGVFLLGTSGGVLALLFLFLVVHTLKNQSIFTLLMTGISINLFFSACIVFIQYMFDYSNTFSVLRWLMGGLIVNGYSEVIILGIIFILLLSAILFFNKELLLLSASDEFCMAKGLNIRKFRFIVLLLISISTAVLVSLTGPIGFVSLIVPHIGRLLSQNRFKETVFLTFLFGGLILMASDLLARLIIYPVEIPVGVVTSFFGAPFFLVILVRSMRKNV